MNSSSDSGSLSGWATVDLTGRTLGDMQILRRLGRGGMADVYVANQMTLGRRVALKVLRTDLARDASYVERFRREARAAARLTHPNIVQVYEVGCIDQFHYISQEFVDGANLRQQLDRNGPLSADEAVVVMQGVADALTAASAEGITHRDIKPENILLSRRGDVKVADFGLAAISRGNNKSDLTQVGMTMGTPLYMSPEQIQGASVDVRSDLYSLGVTMYHLLSGRPPFEAETPLALAVKHLHESPPPLNDARPIRDLPEWLCQCIDRLMEKSPEKRFPTPDTLSQFLHQVIRDQGAIGDATAHLHSKLDATKTLQRLMGVEAKRTPTKYGAIALAAIAVPCFALAAGLWWGAQHETRDLAEDLKSSLTVKEYDSVQAQYLAAARLNEPEGWRKVAELFPADESSVNAGYAAKSSIQLARLFRQRELFQESERVLNQLLANPELSPLYRALVYYELLQTREAASDPQGAADAKDKLRDAYNALKSLANKQRMFDEIVDDEDLIRSLNG